MLPKCEKGRGCKFGRLFASLSTTIWAIYFSPPPPPLFWPIFHGDEQQTHAVKPNFSIWMLARGSNKKAFSPSVFCRKLRFTIFSPFFLREAFELSRKRGWRRLPSRGERRKMLYLSLPPHSFVSILHLLTPGLTRLETFL